MKVVRHKHSRMNYQTLIFLAIPDAV
jgi:hypothetical protein